jgi:4'-phosphopantetheinyl transferase
LKFRFQECGGFSAGASLGPIAPDVVHIYFGRLKSESDEVSTLDALLSADERQRASRFHFEKNRNEFILTRGGLRTMLGSYLGKPPHEIRFAYTNHGKPYLADPAQPQLSFNVSHTDGLAAFAFGWNHAIGVDVEAVRTNFNAEEIAGRFFSTAEKRALGEFPPEERHAAFFRCWTRKEAYIKARGEGLSHPLAQFDVSLAAEPERTLLATRPDPVEAERWLLRPFTAPRGFEAALAVALDL